MARPAGRSLLPPGACPADGVANDGDDVPAGRRPLLASRARARRFESSSAARPGPARRRGSRAHRPVSAGSGWGGSTARPGSGIDATATRRFSEGTPPPREETVKPSNRPAGKAEQSGEVTGLAATVTPPRDDVPWRRSARVSKVLPDPRTDVAHVVGRHMRSTRR